MSNLNVGIRPVVGLLTALARFLAPKLPTVTTVTWNKETRLLRIIKGDEDAECERVTASHWAVLLWRSGESGILPQSVVRSLVGCEITIPPGVAVFDGESVTTLLDRISILNDTPTFKFVLGVGQDRELFYLLAKGLEICAPADPLQG